MDSSKNSQDVNPSYTSDGAARSNYPMTRKEFIDRVLHSGEITRVGQHLALVIFLVAEGRNQLSLSIRELEDITGWRRTAIKEHLDELEIFMRVTLGGGRAKTLFELQGVIQDALATAVEVGSRPPDHTVSRPPAASRPIEVVGWRPPPALAGREVATSLAAAVAVSLAATPVTAASRPPEPVVSVSRPSEGRQAAIKPVEAVSRPPEPSIERERESNSNNNLSLSTTTPRASDEPVDGDIQLNGVAIYGPGFKVPYAAIDQAAFLIGMPKDRARAIAEICARDWAANKKQPASPMAVIKRALKSDFNEGQVQEVKLEKAKADARPESQREQMRRLGEQELAKLKGGRKL